MSVTIAWTCNKCGKKNKKELGSLSVNDYLKCECGNTHIFDTSHIFKKGAPCGNKCFNEKCVC